MNKCVSFYRLVLSLSSICKKFLTGSIMIRVLLLAIEAPIILLNYGNIRIAKPGYVKNILMRSK